MSFMLVFLSTPYMKNPYLKGQFVEVSSARRLDGRERSALTGNRLQIRTDHVLPLTTYLHVA
jgi:hypothetical protein